MRASIDVDDADEGDRGARRWLPFALAAWLLLSPTDAAAYCQTALCAGGTSGVLCHPAQSDDCGTPLRWQGGCFGYSVAARASKNVSFDALSHAMSAAADAWTGSNCGGKAPGLAIFDLGQVSCDQKEYNLKSGNANIVLVHDDVWPYSGAGNTLGLTTVTFDLDTGAIYDTDLELNGTVALTAGDDGVVFDVQSIVTHEMGHMLGLAHSAASDATMFIQYQQGDLSLRSLTSDDEEGVCATYTPADVSACDPTPRRGFATVCDPPPPEADGCQCTLGTPHSRETAGAVATSSLFVLAVARRRRRR